MESPMVYYLYNRGSVIYGLNTKESDIDFLVVVDPEFTLPEEFNEYKTKGYDHRDIPYNVFIDNCDFIFFTTNEWFTIRPPNTVVRSDVLVHSSAHSSAPMLMQLLATSLARLML